MGRSRWWLVVAAALVMAVVALPVGTQGPRSRSTAQEDGLGATPAACARSGGMQRAHCDLSVEPAPAPAAVGSTEASTCAVSESAGYTPCNLQKAYGLTAAAKSDGKGVIVGVVDAYDDPNAATDLAVYRSNFELPACTVKNKCFTKLNQLGKASPLPAASQSAASEISLDLDMVSAICPHCSILLVEAKSNGFSDLGAAEDEAVTLGARVVSNSWGTGEFNGETSFDDDFDHLGVATTFSSGDGAYQGGVQYPSASPYVTSVGGTELTPVTGGRGWSETVWVTPGSPPTQGSGSGCSAYEGKPAWQKDSGCANRTTADVSAVAANVLSYDTYPSGGWYYSYGTSVSSPIIAGVYGLAANPSTITIPASEAYTAPAKDLFDIVKGSTGTCSPNYLCTAGKGYNGPTGMGTPHGIGAFQVPASSPPAISGVTWSGTSSNPTFTIAGTNFGTYPPPGSLVTCQSGDTGYLFGTSGLWFDDATSEWTAGQNGDCIGMDVTSWSSTQVVVTFGNEYSGYTPINTGDSYSVEVQGASFSGTLN
jgi:hypothetical protein